MAGFTIRQLEIFAQVVEHGSFRRCADHIGVSQTSISEHIRELEHRLGAQLFHRAAGGSPRLTPAGERAYGRISAILADINDLSWDISGGSKSRRRLAITMFPYVMRYVHDALGEFRARHPELELAADFQPLLPQQLYQRVQNRELDLAYFIGLDGGEVPTSELMRVEPLALLVAKDHPLARLQDVSAAAIRATPAIKLSPHNPLRLAVDRALEQAELAGSPTAIEADQYELLLASLARGEGFSCMFRATAHSLMESHGLVQLRPENPLPPLQVRQIARHSIRHDAVLKELAELIVQALDPHRTQSGHQ